MNLKTKHCDYCGKRPALEFSYFVDRRMDGAGSMENNYDSIDLCHEHSILLLKQIEQDCRKNKQAKYDDLYKAFKKIRTEEELNAILLTRKAN